MNIRDVKKRDLAAQVAPARPAHSHPPHTHPVASSISRRQFTRTAAGVVAAGAVLGSGLWRPSQARAKAAAGPNPIPGGTPLLGGAFHVFIPADGDPIDAEPATITDFKGYVGNAYLFGTVSRKNKVTGEEVTLPFVDSDMRFMQGIYLGTDQQIHQGTFGFI